MPSDDVVKNFTVGVAECLGERMDRILLEALTAMLIPFEFETIYTLNNTEVTRSKVPGGWMVNILVNSPHGQAVFSTTFIADPEHKWEVK